LKRPATLATIVIALAASGALAQIATQRINGPHRPKTAPASPPVHPVPAAGPLFGDWLPGLDPVRIADFTLGRTEFEAVETPDGGLGPIFNGPSCQGCHLQAGTGGAGTVIVTRFGQRTAAGFDPLASLGGSLLQDKAIDPAVLEVVPPQANVSAKRVTTPLFGAGLIEAIPDATIIQAAGISRPDGIRGRVAFITDVTTGKTRVGRFGWKAQQATLLAFAADAYLNEMGITNRFFPTENAPNGNQALLARFDAVAEPEDVVDPATGKSDIDRATDFMRYLAPPPPGPSSASSLAGARVFESIGCSSCHTPTMFTGPSPVASIANKPVPLYSDLLLHDMGKLGDGIAQAAAGPTEIRTAPLWGLRVRTRLLHDGRSATVSDAIGAHDGEALAAARRFAGLSKTDRQALLDFLGSI
jgi:CxxC motif-containing protein (DUF1111 family)